MDAEDTTDSPLRRGSGRPGVLTRKQHSDILGMARRGMVYTEIAHSLGLNSGSVDYALYLAIKNANELGLVGCVSPGRQEALKTTLR